MDLILYTSGDFHKYISVYVCIVLLCSAAVFTLLLPKSFDHFNNKNYRNYKEMLDLRKSLVDNKRTVDRSINQMIDQYEKEFIAGKAENLKKNSKYSTHKSIVRILIVISSAIIAIVGIPLALYQYLFLPWVSFMNF